MSENRYKEFSVIDCDLRGSNLIEASAGTGKTYSITHLVLRMIIENGIDIQNILVVTFTVAATESLKERIRVLLQKSLSMIRNENSEQSSGAADDPELHAILFKQGEQSKTVREKQRRLEEALASFDYASIFTIHGFCKKILLDYKFQTGTVFSGEIQPDRNEELLTDIHDFWRRNIVAGDATLIRYLQYRRTSPESFLPVLLQYLETDDIGYPVVKMDETFEERYRELQETIETIRQTWRDEKAAIVSIFQNGNGALDKKSYSERYTARRIRNMEELLDSGTEWIDDPEEDYRYFLDSYLREKTAKGKETPENPFFPAFEKGAILSKRLFEMLDLKIIELTGRMLREIKEKVRIESGDTQFTFDDLVLRLLSIIERSSEREEFCSQVQKKYEAVLIDEFQDTDWQQWKIFKKLFLNRSILFLIGDPKQSIYRFRGADIDAYLNARGEVDRRYTLTGNYRSHPDLIGAVNRIFQLNQNPFYFESIRFYENHSGKTEHAICRIADEPEAPLQLIRPRLDEESDREKSGVVETIVNATVSQVMELLEKSDRNEAVIQEPNGKRTPLLPSDIAILVRTRRQALQIKNGLVDKNIPAVLQTDQSVFHTGEAKDLHRILLAVEKPEQTGNIMEALATETLGWRADEIEVLLHDTSRLDVVMEQFRYFQECRKSSGFIALFERILENGKILSSTENGNDLRSVILGCYGGERRLTNLEHLAELLHSENFATLSAELRWFRNALREERRGRDEELIRLESDADAVKVITVHRSKGLEFSIVFLPFLWDERASIKKNHLTLSRDGEERLLLCRTALSLIQRGANLPEKWPSADELEQVEGDANDQELAESLRLIYVALTRARYRCYIAWPDFLCDAKKGDRSAAMYLLHRELFSAAGGDAKGKSDARQRKSEFESGLQRLVDSATGTIAVVAAPQVRNGYFENRKETLHFVEPDETAGRGPGYSIASFTGLIRNEYHEHGDLTDDTLVGSSFSIQPVIEPTPVYDIFHFPAGVGAGLFFHKIFETIDFTDSPESIRETILTLMQFERYGNEWTETVCSTVLSVLNAELHAKKATIRLNRIALAARLTELEFFLPRKEIDTGFLHDLPDGDDFRYLRDSIGKFKVNPEISGFLRGFVDLIFESDGRFYLVDWKSNHLGNSLDDYEGDSLESAVVDHGYVFQYYIYLAALDLYLARTLPGYSYERNFGGVFYLFLRGMTKGGGVFYDLPSERALRHFQNSIVDRKGFVT